MANTKSAAKRARQTPKRTLRNRSIMSGVKTAQKKLLSSLTGAGAADPEARLTAARLYVSELDRAAKRGTIHKNAADRRKSRLARALAGKAGPALAAAPVAATTA